MGADRLSQAQCSLRSIMKKIDCSCLEAGLGSVFRYRLWVLSFSVGIKGPVSVGLGFCVLYGIWSVGFLGSLRLTARERMRFGNIKGPVVKT